MPYDNPPTPRSDDDVEELAVRAAAGDKLALEDLLAAVTPRVERIAGRILQYPQDAEEAAQDALLSIARNIGRFEGRSRFSTWMYAIASNSARSTYRSLKRRAAERPVEDFPTAPDPRTTSVIAGSRLDLLEALDTVGADHPELVHALVLRDVGELDYNEISRLTGVPLGTIKSRIHHARQLVRPLLRAQE